MKKILAFALAAIMTLGVVTPVMAEYNGYSDYNGEYENGYDSYQEPDYLTSEENDNGFDYSFETEFLPPAWGKVGYITDYDGEQLTVRSQFDEEDVIILSLHDGTVIINAEDGTPASIAERTTDRVKVYHAVSSGSSAPSQVLVVALDVPEYEFGPNFHVIEDLYWVDSDNLRITVDGGGLFIFLNRETPLNPHLTRQMVELEHLQKGDEMLFWYQMVALSFPGQAHPTRALFLRNAKVADYENGIEYKYENGVDYTPEYPESGYEPVPAVQPPKALAVPGEGIMRDGVEFFPVRRLADEAGYTVQWHETTRSAYVFVEGITAFRLTVDSAEFVMDEGTYTLPAAVVLIGDTMYAPAEFFYLL